MTYDADLIQARLKVNTEIAEFPDALSDWLRSRTRNCRNLATIRSGKDRRGWLEDAAYFEALAAQTNHIAALEAEVADWKRNAITLSELSIELTAQIETARTAEADMRERAAGVCDTLINGTKPGEAGFTVRAAFGLARDFIMALPLSTDAAPAQDIIAEKAQ